MIKCTSCRREVTDDYVRFRCPACGKTEIVRCDRCRKSAVIYKCSACGFTGP